MKYLLDVNALIAALWEPHQHHKQVADWLPGKSVSVCPISELGFLRICTHPRALNVPMHTAQRLLDDFRKKPGVNFVPCDSTAEALPAGKSDEVTDAYLAELAARHKMKLASLDTGIQHAAVEIVR